ncbi:hypothetical protein H4Q26_006689 [Puccinia striiformis f. sp. tritici PST-130]|nr:hypothetical protein Pst134EB_020449 [Puccinia striiformis f. sp. tritici]KAI9610546.1 hypothetical protein H4Q26_006689 [Puccinia striiformis f. sp. tritici PST-130]
MVSQPRSVRTDESENRMDEGQQKTKPATTAHQPAGIQESDPSVPPELPPKLQSYPSIVSTRDPHTQSNKVLVGFLFSLSNLIFFGGSLAGLLVWVYQKYIFPKLKFRTEILKKLNISTLKSYDKLQENLKKLVESNPKLYQATLAKLSAKTQQILSTISSSPNDQLGGGLEKEGKLKDRIETSEEPSSTVEHKTQDSKNIEVDPNHTPIPSSSSSSSSTSPEPEKEKGIHEDEDRSSDRELFNQPIIDYLEKIAQGLRKRSNHRGQLEKGDLDSEEDSNSSTGTDSSLGGIESLKTSLKAMGNELAEESQLSTRIHQKLSASSHPHRAFGLHNYWNTSLHTTPSAKQVDDDPYFIALMELKNQIRNLKGALLNRKKFY